MAASHQPVMVGRVMHLLAPKAGSCIIDTTLGLAGHAEFVARSIGPEGMLLGIDCDPEMLRLAETRLRPFGKTIKLAHAKISSLAGTARTYGMEQVDGILMDLGLCSAQLDEPERGFSFHPGSEPVTLDMRLDQTQGETLGELLERIELDPLAEILKAGDVHQPRRIARAILEGRPVRTVQQLLDILGRIRLAPRRHHPATLVFQALRLAVNDELHEIETALEACVELLKPGGRLAVLSYHSGEDRRVKQFLAREVRGCICPPDLPLCGCGREPRMRVLERGVGPDPDEVLRNPRARSARLRGGERW